MPLPETEYCAEQINVPPRLPAILKQFCKSAIRTQPYDLLRWSSAYFHALADGEEPPTKLRLEYPPARTAHGLTPGLVKALFRQLGANYNKVVPLEMILKRWDCLCLDQHDFDLINCIGAYREECQVKRFLAIAAGLLGRTLTETMIMVCELFTFEPDGGSAMIPIRLFMDLYGYLADLRCDGAEHDSTEELCVCSMEASSDITLEGLREEAPGAEPLPAQDSLDSQDTQADIELEYDSFTKEDANAGITLRSFGEETGESYPHEGEASFFSSDRPDSFRTRSSDNAESFKEESAHFESEATEAEAEPVKSASGESKGSVGAVTEGMAEPSDKAESKMYYPDVPGIGRRLLPEEVATVAIWLTDCARRQEGMVGPRNIRHINCPPLEGCGCGGPSNESL